MTEENYDPNLDAPESDAPVEVPAQPVVAEDSPQPAPEQDAAVVDTEELPADATPEETAQNVITKEDATNDDVLNAIAAVKEQRFRSQDSAEVDRLENVINSLAERLK